MPIVLVKLLTAPFTLLEVLFLGYAFQAILHCQAGTILRMTPRALLSIVPGQF